MPTSFRYKPRRRSCNTWMLQDELLAAVRHGDVDYVMQLVKDKPDFNKKFGCTVLHHAAAQGSLAVVRALIESGFDPNAFFFFYITPIHRALRNNHKHILAYLLAHGGKPIAEYSSENMIYVAAKSGDPITLRLLLIHGANIEDKSKFMESTGKKETDFIEHPNCTALHIAVISGKLDAVNFLLDQGANPDAKNGNGRKPLHLACQAGKLEIAIALLRRGANLEKKDRFGLTPLQLAKQYGHTGLTRHLIVNWGAKTGRSLSATLSGEKTLHRNTVHDQLRNKKRLSDGAAGIILNMAFFNGRQDATAAQSTHTTGSKPGSGVT